MLRPSRGIETHPDGQGNLNAVVNGNWNQLDREVNPGAGRTCRLDNGTPGVSGTTLTISGTDLLDSSFVGATIRFSTDFSTAVISSVTDGTHAVASVAGVKTAQDFEVYRTDQLPETVPARAIFKVPQMTSAMDKKIPRWDDSKKRFVPISAAGFGFAAGQILFGAGTGNDVVSSADFTWDDSGKLLTVNGQAVFNDTVRFGVTTNASVSGSTTLDLALANVFDLKLTGAATLANPNNVKVGAIYMLLIRQDATGGRTLAWGSNWKFRNNANTIAMEANALTIVFALAITSTELLVFHSMDPRLMVYIEPVQRVFLSMLPAIGVLITLTADVAYFVYLGKTATEMTPKFVEFFVGTAATGAQTAEVGLFSSVNPPNKGSLSLTKLVATGTVDSLTTTGVKRNTSAFATVIAANTHLWAGIRTNMATTQPAISALTQDFSQGLVLSTATAGVLTGAGPWTGAIFTPGSYAGSVVCPDLRVTLD